MGRWSPLLYAKRSSLPSPLQPPFPNLHSPSQLPLSLLPVLHIILIHHAIPSRPSDSYRYIYFHPRSTSSLNKELLFRQLLYPASTEWFTEDQAFSRSYDSTPCPPPLFPSPVSTLDRRHTERLRMIDILLTGRGGASRSRIIKPQESLALYKSFNTLCLYPY
jgi:hypothetical protein